MGIYQIQMVILFVSFIFHFPVCYFFIIYLNLGVEGAAIAYSFTFTTSFLIMIFYVWFYRPIQEEAWHWFNKDSFKQWGLYFYFGIPSALMFCLEWFCFEIITIFAG